ncbi:hypothetical protein BGZ72_001783, partial [Mortierella alpina]
MDQTQSFRLIGTTQILRIPIQHIDGQNVVSWDSIEQVFPGVRSVKNGDVTIPCYIKHFPRVVLDVVSSTSVEPVNVSPSKSDPTDRKTDLTDAPADAPVEDRVITALDVPPETAVGNFGFFDASSSSSPSDVDTTSKAILFQQIVTHASRKAKKNEIEQRFISLLAPEVQETVRASSNIYEAYAKAIKDGHGELSRVELSQVLSGHFRELKTMLTKNTDLQEAMNARQEEVKQLQTQVLDNQNGMKQLQEQVLDNQKEMKQLQERALDQLAVLQSRVQAVLTQTYELHEYPIPRLFVVLPQDPSGWDTMNPFSNKFRLYFLCECGEHTKSTNSKSYIPHHIHLAKHEGYEITRPTEFFRQYGSYVLTILRMLKFGITVAGVAVPALPLLLSAESIDQATSSLKQLQEHIELGVDRAIGHIDNVLAHHGGVVVEAGEQVEDKEALEGADLRKLNTFLEGTDGNKALGNLYRTVTNEGHVKWVCGDHYRENYNKTAAEAFRRAVDSVGGLFDENNGLVKVRLRSRVLAEQFYSALEKAISVHELDIYLDMEGTRSDLEILGGALKRSRVSILRLDLQQFHPSFSSKLLSASARYEVLSRIMEHPNMRMIHIVLPKDLIKLSNFPPKRPSHLHKLSFEMVPGPIGGKEFGVLSETLRTNATLTILDLRGNSIGDNGALALSEALKINSTLTTLDLWNNSIGDNGAQALSEALKTNSTLTTLDLRGNSIWFKGLLAFSEAFKTNSTMTTLDLRSNLFKDNIAMTLSETFKTNSILTTLDLQNNSIGDNGAQALSEGLKINSTLTTLDLRNNSIGSKGAQAL